MALTFEDLYKIIDEAGTQVDMDKLTPDADIISIGADSLDIMNVLLGVQEATGVDVEDDDIETLSTANKICEYVNNRA